MTQTTKQPESATFKTLLIQAAAGVLAVALATLRSSTKTDDAARDMFEWAVINCVRPALNAAHTATFCSWSEASIEGAADRWQIRGWIDTNNSFGDMLRKHFYVQISMDADGQWRCANVRFDRPCRRVLLSLPRSTVRHPQATCGP